MAAMAPALTDAPAEARHIRLKLAAESNGNSTNLLLSSSISSSDTAGANGKPHHEDNCCHCCNGKEPLSEPLSLGKLQPLVASYLCSHVGPVAEESVLIKPSVLKKRGLLNGDLLLRTQLSGGQPKSFVNGGGSGTGTGGGSAMVPVNGLAKKAAVPSTALPEKGSVAPLNGDNAKPPTGAGALLPLSSKSGDVIATISVPRADSKHLRELGDLHSRAPEDTGVNGSSENPQIKSETPAIDRSHVGRTGALSETNNNSSTPLDAPQSSALCQRSCSPSSPSSGIGALVLRERAQQTQRRQADVSARLQRLCKRLQVVQAKQVERHVKQQLTGFLHHTLSQFSSFRRDSIAQLLKDGSLPPELEKLHLSGTTSLRVAEAQFDSDATESSSGGESDIEEEELARVDTEQRHVKLWRRAEGRFALERASIISRWTWLQAHISDLEYRIRQHTDIYRQIRTSKGSVELGDSSSSHQTRTEKPKPQHAAGDFGQTLRFPIDRSINEFFHSMAEVSDVKLSPTPESGCSAARVRPLNSCKRRRLIQPGTLQNLNSKVQKVCSPASPCDVNSACVMCGGGQLHPKAELQFERPLVDNVAVQDPGVHPTLSLQSDIPVSVQLQRMLKSHWQSRHMEKVRPLKKLSLKHKLSHYSSSSSSSSSALSKHKFRLSNSPMAAIRFPSHKNRSERARKPVEAGIRLTKVDAHTPCRTGRLLDRSLSRKRVRENSLDRTESPKLQFDAGSPYQPPQSSIQPSTPNTVSRQMCLPSDSSTPLGPSSQTGSCSMPMRKRRSENSFDINNIVIPMSVAATTRVEKLQYKEIITPSWRELGAFPQHLAAVGVNVEVEDLSDAACMLRHQKCEDQERNRWRWTALTPAKRRGSRSYKSVDGRTTPSLIGTNPSTPQPSSPDTGHFHLLQDYGPIPSPLSPPSPDTPCSRDAHTPSSRDSYTPHTRDAHRPVYSEDTRCSTPDCTYEERTVQPWEHRIFPLSEDPVLEAKEDPQPHPRFSCGAESESETSST
ncbi:KAT8 regulatory NSL complex subunit 1 isoform 2-T2 [Clarias gariepinus]|uniref:KAT8 regulatory NSL complex subunit 1 isoform X2 n=1 Tax=Clarias gariepinus TaxID=13013 RepID=UPI00234C3E25|nr:KAT8 regulatory NSL complex subunit 1 isoform X2 [Clarias gariepinus]